eukprot:g3702.t1
MSKSNKRALLNTLAPHPIREGSTQQACTFLQATPGEQQQWRDGWVRANDGHVPNVLYAVVWLDICSVGLVIPLLSVYSRDLGSGPAFSGVLSAVYGFMNLIGAGLLGSLSDTYGRRFVFILSLVGASLGYFMVFISVTFARSLLLLFLSRLPVGLAKQTMTVSRAIVSDCSHGEDRSKVLSRVAVFAGLGFMVGPAAGGIISSVVHPAAPPLLAVFLFQIAFVLIYIYLPETAPLLMQPLISNEKREMKTIQKTKKERETSPTSSPTSSLLSSKSDDDDENRGARLSLLQVWKNSFAEMVRHPKACRLLASRMFVQLPYLMMTQTFSEFTLRRFSFTPRQNGYVLAYCGVISVLANAILGPVVSRYKTRIGKTNAGVHSTASVIRKWEGQLVVSGSLGVAASLVSLSIAATVRSLYIALIPLAIGSAIFRTAIQSILTKSVPRDEIGTVNGATDASDSLARVIAPLFSGILMQYIGLSAPFVFGAFFCVFGSIIFLILENNAQKRGKEK